MKKLFTLSILCFSFLLPLKAQELLTPEDFLGYSLGSKFSFHHRVVDYFEYIAANSDHVKLQPYGTTYEGRPLMVAFIGNEKNIKRLEDIRKHNLSLAGLEEAPALADAPAIVWLSYNVHGNEAVSTEASMAVLHALATAEEDGIRDWLDNTLVVVDPAINPDGRDRYATWYNQVANRIPNPNRESREHHEPWPGGRPNHYLFDLNRDWAWQTQAESQQRMALYNQWLPQIHADFHEQGIDRPYYFAPAAEPYHQYITDWQREFQTTIGKKNSQYFDAESWLYFTREVFDLFYPSYGDTYPTFNGAIGMTYEQGGSGRAGLAVETASEDTLTLRDRIAHHYTTSMATIETTAENAELVKNNFSRFFKESAANPPGKYRNYLISRSGNSADKLKQLRRFLDRHQIRYQEAARTATHKGYGYRDAARTSFRTQAGDLVIPLGQPKAVLAQVLFEPKSQLSDSITYDLTAWAVPYMMGLEAYATADNIATRAYQQQEQEFSLDLAVEKPYAYLQEWNTLDDARFLAELLQQGVEVRFAELPFTSSGKRFEAGSLIILRADNQALGERFDYLVRNAAQEWEQPLTAATTGFVTEGKDFGSGSVHFLDAPAVALVGGEGVSSLAFGEVWHFFEQQINYPVTVLDTDYIASVNWSRYDVVILPNGWYSSILKNGTYDALMDWVKQGGRLIIMQNALSAFAGKEGLALEEKMDEEEEEELSEEDLLSTYADRERESMTNYNTGAVYRITLDETHPLAFGYNSQYFSMKTDSDAFAYLKNGWNVGTIRKESDLISGFVGQNAREKLTKTLVFGVEPKGRGALIYMADNPLFRAFWEEGKLLFANAVFMVD